MSRGGGAGRGRGRGRGSATITMEAMGLKRDEMPAVVVQPPDLFPERLFRPVPLRTGPIDDYQLKVRRRFRESMRTSEFYLDGNDGTKRIVRYSDKYEKSSKLNCESLKKIAWDPRLFPDELRQTQKLASKKVKQSTTTVTAAPTTATTTVVPSKPRSETDQAVIKSEELSDKEDEEEEDNEAEVADEELEDEEETDYALSYFDNGDAYIEADSDDNDGPVY